MNDFLLSRFPHSYARIYNGMIQRKGSSLVSKYIGGAGSGENPDRFIEMHATSRPTDPVYEALKDVYEIRQAGYLQLLKHLKKNILPIPLRKTRAVILRVDENERWKKMFDAKGTQFDLLLALPSLSRTVSVSTSDIGLNKEHGEPKPFDVLEIDAFGFYDEFNKLHGTSHRSVIMTEQTPTERAGTFNSVKFLLRTVQDAKMLANCTNMRLYSSFSGDIHPTMGFYFLCVCRISDTKSVPGSAILPTGSAQLSIGDDSGNIRAFMEPDALALSGQMRAVARKIGACSGASEGTFEKFSDLAGTDGQFLLLCGWPMGSDAPKIVCALGLEGAPYGRLYAEAFMTTRCKSAYGNLKDLLGEDVRESTNLYVDSNGRWAYYKNSEWNADVFSFLAERGFKKPGFSEILKSGLQRAAVIECHRMIAAHLRHHEYARNLYDSPDPDSELSSVYDPIVRQTDI